MRKLLLASLISAFAASSWAQTVTHPREWHATVKVTDDTAIPLADADVQILFDLPTTANQSPKGDKVVGLTDTNGLFTTSHRDQSLHLGFKIAKPGYYGTFQQYDLGFPDDENTQKKLNPFLTFVLTKIGTPIPMYARKARIQIPELDKQIGFDLVEYDWVAPYGKGKKSDFVFQGKRRWVSRDDFSSSATLRFSSQGDGLLSMPIGQNQATGPRIPAVAPLSGYTGELVRNLEHTPSSGWKKDTEDKENYYFRIRTVLDEHDVVKSALYGKIYGDFSVDPINSKTLWISFTYYLNPESSSPNTEFDSKQNLFKNLPFEERVLEP